MSRKLVAMVLLLGVVFCTERADAAWLYLKDGTLIETDGAWESRGRMLRFKTRAGVLQMLPAEEVDLPVSEAVSRWARPSSGLNEVHSSPDIRGPGRVTTEWVEVIPLDANWDLILYGWEQRHSQGGRSAQSKCLPATGLAATDSGTLVVQIGTTIENVDLYGVRSLALGPLRALVEGQPLCLVQKELRPGRNDRGRYPAYALTREGRDLGLHLISAGHAKPSEKPHHLANEYRQEFARRARRASAAPPAQPEGTAQGEIAAIESAPGAGGPGAVAESENLQPETPPH